jgi:hypothetical protein
MNILIFLHGDAYEVFYDDGFNVTSVVRYRGGLDYRGEYYPLDDLPQDVQELILGKLLTLQRDDSPKRFSYDS